MEVHSGSKSKVFLPERHVRCTLKTGRAVSSLVISSRFLTQPLAQATVPSCALPLQRQHPIANMLATAISLLVSSSILHPSPGQAKQVALPAPMQAPQLAQVTPHLALADVDLEHRKRCLKEPIEIARKRKSVSE